MRLNEAVRYVREQLGLSLRAVASRMDGTDFSTISRWETGKIPVDVVQVELVAHAMQVPVELFYLLAANEVLIDNNNYSAIAIIEALIHDS